jgi:hypothetical protein
MLSLEHTPPSQPLRQQGIAITSSQNVISRANHEEKEVAVMEDMVDKIGDLGCFVALSHRVKAVS